MASPASASASPRATAHSLSRTHSRPPAIFFSATSLDTTAAAAPESVCAIRHAIVRNFVTYNRTEREHRPQIALYAGAMGAGMVSSDLATRFTRGLARRISVDDYASSLRQLRQPVRRVRARDHQRHPVSQGAQIAGSLKSICGRSSFRPQLRTRQHSGRPAYRCCSFARTIARGLHTWLSRPQLPRPPQRSACISILVLGFVLGMRHATDADHVVAVSTIVSRERRIRSAAWIGALWGAGHTITIFAVGVGIIVFTSGHSAAHRSLHGVLRRPDARSARLDESSRLRQELARRRLHQQNSRTPRPTHMAKTDTPMPSPTAPSTPVPSTHWIAGFVAGPSISGCGP